MLVRKNLETRVNRAETAFHIENRVLLVPSRMRTRVLFGLVIITQLRQIVISEDKISRLVQR